MKEFVWLVVFYFIRLSLADFEVPDALIEVFQPQGLRVSIPDQEGIKLFAFHAKINEEMNGREGGTFSRDITKAKNGRWTFYDPYAKLKLGDRLYYWTYVDYFDGKNKLGYTKDDQEFVVSQLLDKKGSPSTPLVPKPAPEEETLPSGCKASATISKHQKMCKGEEIYSENFDKLKPDLWTPEIKYAGKPDFEFVLYTDRKEILSVVNNELVIRPIPTEQLFGKGFVSFEHEIDLGDKCTGIPGTTECVQKAVAFLILPPVASGRITTKNKWSFKFGKIEIRAKLPKGDWIYPQLFLNPVNEEYGPDYASGQIRIAYLPGNKAMARKLYGGCVLGSSPAARNYALKKIEKNEGSWSDDYHKFTAIWKPDEIILMVDDQVYGNIYPPKGGFVSESQNLDLDMKNVERWRNGTSFAPFDKEMYLTIGVGVGGHCFEDRNDGSKPWKNNDPKAQKNFYKASSQWLPTWDNSSVLKVDYVKIWAL
ncbi:beta-1,3-glucan-binding protein-like [Tribolium madens]|uniref:beta-1,3-glucan-binding protein-like n=1 Tax=Tribolium madens TaxID=41895 RepID=UPI001CF72E28|nr:beta-1,3-glucan-binding protein-like [Tribolium madens]